MGTDRPCDPWAHHLDGACDPWAHQLLERVTLWRTPFGIRPKRPTGRKRPREWDLRPFRQRPARSIETHRSLIGRTGLPGGRPAASEEGRSGVLRGPPTAALPHEEPRAWTLFLPAPRPFSDGRRPRTIGAPRPPSTLGFPRPGRPSRLGGEGGGTAPTTHRPAARGLGGGGAVHRCALRGADQAAPLGTPSRVSRWEPRPSPNGHAGPQAGRGAPYPARDGSAGGSEVEEGRRRRERTGPLPDLRRPRRKSRAPRVERCR